MPIIAWIIRVTSHRYLDTRSIFTQDSFLLLYDNTIEQVSWQPFPVTFEGCLISSKESHHQRLLCKLFVSNGFQFYCRLLFLREREREREVTDYWEQMTEYFRLQGKSSANGKEDL